MTVKPFASIVSVLEPGRLRPQEFKAAVQDVNARLGARIQNIQFIVVGNGIPSPDIVEMKRILAELPDIEFFILTRGVEYETALLAGMEHVLGDVAVTLDMSDYDGDALERMLEKADAGADAVVVCTHIRKSGLYGLLRNGFYATTSRIGDDAHEGNVTAQRLLNRQLLNFILQHDHAAELLRMPPMRSGFSVETLWSEKTCGQRPRRKMYAVLTRMMRLLTSDSARPMRIVSILGMIFGLINVAYMLYVAVILLFFHAVKGWTTLSLQISGMFFIICFMMALMAEYVVQIHGRAVKRPEYYVAQELKSNMLTHQRALNVEGVEVRRSETGVKSGRAA